MRKTRARSRECARCAQDALSCTRPGPCRCLLLDGELVAFNEVGAPHWPLVCDRVLHGNTSVPVTFVAFDILRVDGHDLTANPWVVRRAVRKELGIETWCSRMSDVFDDGAALFDAVVTHGL